MGADDWLSGQEKRGADGHIYLTVGR